MLSFIWNKGLIMLNPASVLKKTEAGLVAIKERDRALVPRARTLLIMMDGSKTAAQLAAMNTDAVQGMELLNQLVQSGFAMPLDSSTASSATAVTPQAVTAPQLATKPPGAVPMAVPSPTPAPVAPTLAPRPARDLKTSIRAGTRFLESWLGPVSESFCLQLERCKTQQEFDAKVLEIKLLLASARSVKKAEEFSIAALGH
jgi:hypothetical protein